MEKLRKACILD